MSSLGGDEAYRREAVRTGTQATVQSSNAWTAEALAGGQAGHHMP